MRRLESDVTSLFAFYSFGALHRGVRLKWGFLDEMYPVDWAHPGDPNVYDILKRAKEESRWVDVVFGTAPGWKDPWSRTVKLRVEEFGWNVTMRHGPFVYQVPRWETQAVRFSGETHGS